MSFHMYFKGCDLKMIARKSTKLNPASSQLEKTKFKILILVSQKI